MTIVLNNRWKHSLILLALVAMLVSTSGCFSLRNPFGSRNKIGKNAKGLSVVALTNNEALQLGAMDIANILTGIGFSPEQVMAIGEDLQQALMIKGRAGIVLDGTTVVQLRVANERIQIYSTSSGYHEYDVKMHQFILGGPGLQAGQMPQTQQAPMMSSTPSQQLQMPTMQQQNDIWQQQMEQPSGMMQMPSTTYPNSTYPATQSPTYSY